jgi:hypothetical protein
MAITICIGLSHPTGWAALPSENIGIFIRAEKISEDINDRIFFINNKWLKVESVLFSLLQGCMSLLMVC